MRAEYMLKRMVTDRETSIKQLHGTLITAHRVAEPHVGLVLCMLRSEVSASAPDPVQQSFRELYSVVKK